MGRGKNKNWNKYVIENYTNEYGVMIFDWYEKKEKYNREDSVICICPNCKKYFISREIRIIVENSERQIKSCQDCAHKIAARKRTADLTEMKFGKLTVKSFAGYNNGYAYWNCICDCGNKTKTTAHFLLTGHTKSCGCFRSNLEKEVAFIFRNINVSFNKEKTFKDFVSPNGGHPRFDFEIIDNNNNTVCLIECQGTGHDATDNREFGKFQREVTDNIKKIYCKKNNIPLYEIWYNDNVEEKIKEILIELNMPT